MGPTRNGAVEDAQPIVIHGGWYCDAQPVICRRSSCPQLPIPSFPRLMYRPLALGAGYVWSPDHLNIGKRQFWGIISESKDTNDKIQAQWNHSYTYNNDLLSGSYSESPHATQHNIAFQHIKVQMQFVSKHGSIKFRQKGVNIGTIPFLAEMSQMSQMIRKFCYLPLTHTSVNTQHNHRINKL